MPQRKMARAARRVQAFWPRAKTLSRPNSLRAAEIQPGPPAGPRRACGPPGNCTGTPEEVARCEAGYTGQYLKTVLK